MWLHLAFFFDSFQSHRGVILFIPGRFFHWLIDPLETSRRFLFSFCEFLGAELASALVCL